MSEWEPGQPLYERPISESVALSLGLTEHDVQVGWVRHMVQILHDKHYDSCAICADTGVSRDAFVMKFDATGQQAVAPQ